MKKFKRYEGGGEVMGEMDPMEAAAKKRGLEMSNKEAPVGFFERIRMGNIVLVLAVAVIAVRRYRLINLCPQPLLCLPHLHVLCLMTCTQTMAQVLAVVLAKQSRPPVLRQQSL